MSVSLLLTLAVLAADPAPQPKTETLRGKVVPLAKVVEKYGGRLDPEAAAQWYGLVTDDGKVYPLVKDDVSRMFFSDARLLDRPMQLTGRVLPGSTLFQVLQVRSIVKGQLCEVYYWCDTCSIKRFEKKECDCCHGPLELREEPVKK